MESDSESETGTTSSSSVSDAEEESIRDDASKVLKKYLEVGDTYLKTSGGQACYVDPE